MGQTFSLWIRRDEDIIFADVLTAMIIPQVMPFKASTESAEGLEKLRSAMRSMSNGDGIYGRQVHKKWNVEHVLEDEAEMYIHTPLEKEKTDLIIIYAHGGGFVIGDAKCGTGLEYFNELSSRGISFQWVSVEYRLAPEDPYPAGLEDMLKAIRIVLRRFPDSRIALTGVSAGASLALEAALDLNPAERQRIISLALFFPFLNPESNTPSFRKHAYRWNFGHWLKWCWKVYYANTEKPPRILDRPLDQFSTLPPVLIATSKADPLRDDGTLLFAKLKRENVTHIEGYGSHACMPAVDRKNAVRMYDTWADMLSE